MSPRDILTRMLRSVGLRRVEPKHDWQAQLEAMPEGYLATNEPDEFELLGDIYDLTQKYDQLQYALPHCELADFPARNLLRIRAMVHLLLGMSEEFSDDLRRLLDQYRELWNGSPDEAAISKVNARREAIHEELIAPSMPYRETLDRFFKTDGHGLTYSDLGDALTSIRANTSPTVELLNATRFLTGDREWETEQDGPGFYTGVDALRGGVSRETVRSAFERTIDALERGDFDTLKPVVGE